MTRWRNAFVAALFLSASTVRGAEFPALIQELNVSQNRMAAGAASVDDVTRRLDEVERWIAASDPSVWQEERNVRAGVVYLLGGGRTQALRDMRDAGFMHASTVPLLDAALDYAEGKQDASKNLLTFDARSFPALLGGHVALVQGGSLIGVDDRRATDLLELAVLLMPASLVEEAALRREVSFLEPESGGRKIAVAADRYEMKYRASPFAAQFWESVRRITDRAAEIDDKTLLTRLEAVFDKAPQAERREFRLALCRQMVFAGRLDEARTELDSAEAGADESARRRIAFYRSTLDALASRFAVPESIQREAQALGADERQFASIATNVVARLWRADEKAAATTGDENLPILGAARRAIAESDALLERARAK